MCMCMCVHRYVCICVYVFTAAVTMVGGVLVDQSEADRDLSATQRLGLAAGSTLEGAAGFAGDIEPVADTLTVAGMTLSITV